MASHKLSQARSVGVAAVRQWGAYQFYESEGFINTLYRVLRR